MSIKSEEKSEKRIVSFPHMGNVFIPVSAMLKTMGANILLPPNNNMETLTLGTRYSAETVCLPYKLNLGNYIQALEAGANVLLMFQAPGTCRLGNYASMAEAKLRDLGYDFEMIIFDMYKGKLIEVSRKFSQATGNTSITKTLHGIKLGFAKFNALDIIERKLFYIRPREIKQGSAEKVYNTCRAAINTAISIRKVKNILKSTLEKFNSIQINKNKDILKIYLTGEFFVLLDPFTNMEIERKLGLLGIEVERQVMLSDWTNNILLPKWLHRKESHRERSSRVASSYMKRAVGGDCIESIGDVVYAAKKEIDGVIHIGPFNCNPEIVSQCILPHVSRKENIPVISLIMDEQTGHAGLMTRLEAFVDLIHRRKITKITA
ncbi:MAG: CoA protein activase [bacterium]